MLFNVAVCESESDYISILESSALSGSGHWSADHSYTNSVLNTVAENGHTGAWSAARNSINEYIQADLGANRIVAKIATQGRSIYDQWVTSYHFAYSSDGTNYHFILSDGSKRLFNGNTDRNTIITHKLDSPIVARYVRLYVQAWSGHISMRWGVYGCDVGVGKTCKSIRATYASFLKYNY